MTIRCPKHLRVAECLRATGLQELLLCADMDINDVVLSEDGSLSTLRWLCTTSGSDEPFNKKKDRYKYKQ